MKRLRKIINDPNLALGLAPIIFALSQIIIIGYYWLFGGYVGNFTLTISRYVGLAWWTSLLFLVFNVTIIIIMFRYYQSLRKSRSPLWFSLGCLQVVGFAMLSIFPHNVFLPESVRSLTVNLHLFGARLMFIAMFLMALETLRLSHPNHLKFLQKFKFLKSNPAIFPKTTTLTCILFILYGSIYSFLYGTNLAPLWNYVFIIETGYIYAFLAFLLLTRSPKPSA